MTAYGDAMRDYVESRGEGLDIMARYVEAYASARPEAERPRMVHTTLGFHRRFGFGTVETFTRDQVIAMTEELSREAAPAPGP